MHCRMGMWNRLGDTEVFGVRHPVLVAVDVVVELDMSKADVDKVPAVVVEMTAVGDIDIALLHVPHLLLLPIEIYHVAYCRGTNRQVRPSWMTWRLRPFVSQDGLVHYGQLCPLMEEASSYLNS